MWPLNLVRDLPKRSGRLLAVLAAGTDLRGMKILVYWIYASCWYVFDIIGGPELAQIVIRTLTKTRSLSTEELMTAKTVLGPDAIRFRDVRIAMDGLLLPFFRMNRNRAFATWHTINLPASKASNISLMVHELTHVYQYEKVGSLYISQGLWAQFRFGRQAYDYGGADGLLAGRAAGKRLNDYNREQQSQIAQDYISLLQNDRDIEAYSPFIRELQGGLI
ncbi:MAG: hypothetical protein WA996_11125 [Candidatus Promineifilaceae bacterium]